MHLACSSPLFCSFVAVLHRIFQRKGPHIHTAAKVLPDWQVLLLSGAVFGKLFFALTLKRYRAELPMSREQLPYIPGLFASRKYISSRITPLPRLILNPLFFFCHISV